MDLLKIIESDISEMRILYPTQFNYNELAKFYTYTISEIKTF